MADRDPLLAFIVARSRLSDRPLELADLIDDPADPIVLVTDDEGDLAYTRSARQLAQELRTGRVREPDVSVGVGAGGTRGEADGPVARSFVRAAEDRDGFEIRVEGAADVRPSIEAALRGNTLLLHSDPLAVGEPPPPTYQTPDARYRCDLNQHLVWLPKGHQSDRCVVDDHGRRCRGELRAG